MEMVMDMEWVEVEELEDAYTEEENEEFLRMAMGE